jgi:hypothetical protein
MVTPVIVSNPPSTNPDGSLSIDFTATYDGYELKDAIVGTPAFINVLTADEINTMEVERFNNWYDIVTAPVPDEPVVEE